MKTQIDPDLKTAVILGNGSSLTQFDLSSAHKLGTTFGCNALYRIYKPDYLVAIDSGMITEIRASDFPQDRFIVPPVEEQHEPAQLYRDLGYSLPDSDPAYTDFPRSNAGMNAMREAIKQGHDQLIMVGFDFIVASETISTSNMFNGTPNYGPLTKASFHDTVNRMRYLNWFIDQYPSVRFVFTYPIINGSVTVWEFTCNQTVYGMSYEELSDYCRGMSARA